MLHNLCFIFQKMPFIEIFYFFCSKIRFKNHVLKLNIHPSRIKVKRFKLQPVTCVMSGFRCEVYEQGGLLGYYTPVLFLSL
jgi:hypothetical protein